MMLRKFIEGLLIAWGYFLALVLLGVAVWGASMIWGLGLRASMGL
jgi:hypothetical protein